ncbi:hypothetical protein Tco_0953550 [Tanacetum coccineum]|uniref:Zinc finger, CCHC-type n=1 Tax=Tanacetum coccineum TaxID=301880 RepID=A0ABQ5E079_9ASTR
MESEFVTLAAAGNEAEWQRNLVYEIPLWPKPMSTISIRCDSAATLAKAYSQVYNGKSRHLGVRYKVMKGLSECKASESNFRRIQVKDIVKEVEDYLKPYSSADPIMSGTIQPIPPPFGASSGNPGNPNVNRVDTMPTTTDPINITTTKNMSQSVVDENPPQLLNSRGGSHVTNVPAFDKEDFTS